MISLAIEIRVNILRHRPLSQILRNLFLMMIKLVRGPYCAHWKVAMPPPLLKTRFVTCNRGHFFQVIVSAGFH